MGITLLTSTMIGVRPQADEGLRSVLLGAGKDGKMI